MMSTRRFVLIYTAMFALTYLVRYLFLSFGIPVGYSFNAGTYAGENFFTPAELCLLAVYGVMVYCCVQRAAVTGRTYLLFMPLTAGIFDLFFSLVVFAPTTLNLLGFVFGVLGPQDDDIELRMHV
ncbi:hypothetical protein [Vibrio xiamenensis]|nr:hypothetical protein [Vibrio xiamenensis]